MPFAKAQSKSLIIKNDVINATETLGVSQQNSVLSLYMLSIALLMREIDNYSLKCSRKSLHP